MTRTRWLLAAPFLFAHVFSGESVRPDSVRSSFWTWQPASALGDRVDMKAFRGHYVLLNFWGEWCPKCREEIPFLARLRRKYGRSGLVVLGLLKSYDLQKARGWILENKMDWPQIPLPDTLEAYFQIRKFPTNLLVSPEGKIVMDGFSRHYQDFVRRMNLADTLRIR